MLADSVSANTDEICAKARPITFDKSIGSWTATSTTPLSSHSLKMREASTTDRASPSSFHTTMCENSETRLIQLVTTRAPNVLESRDVNVLELDSFTLKTQLLTLRKAVSTLPIY